MVSQKLIDEFKQIFKEKYKVSYTDEEAREAAERLVGFYKLLIKVDQRNKQKEHDSTKSQKNSR